MRRELKVWARTHHENVIPLLGTTTDCSCPAAGPNPIAMISEWMERGNLETAMKTGLTDLECLHLVRGQFPVLDDAMANVASKFKLCGVAKGLEHCACSWS